MSYTIVCYTLFDVTTTGVLSRHRPPENVDIKEWTHKRNTQCNFDTVVQAISLRSQPEVTKQPKQIKIKFDEFDKFGFLFEQEDETEYDCWVFEFEIQHPSVFNDGITELGALYTDCAKIPMIKCGTEWSKLPGFLDTSEELRNIYFEIR